jgi:hypothetical protein
MLSLHLPHGAEFGGVTVVHPLQQAATRILRLERQTAATGIDCIGQRKPRVKE